ncbi:ParM/StbA family protein [Alicyclobacillus dauci]|uniref:ParM/StbA family protein n=1 Tax=Alicyclobacillus dauci TaxID=1475485 RepID=A0ABY6YXH1_9BACL|nr:ParM/StbA family protein [Alicyclobacillus dauci]WAH35221.1 ParM/StbA family protein [Alicyclobacillus dauci]
MKIAIDQGNQYVKAISETGERVLFRSVIAEGKRRQLFALSKTKSVLTDSLQVSFRDGVQSKHYYVGKMAERFGALPEYVFGKERLKTESAERIIWTTLGLLVRDDEPVDLVLDFPYSQFGMVKDQLTARLDGATQRVDVLGREPRNITIRSVTAYPQGLVAAYALAKKYKDLFTYKDGYVAIVDIGGDTVDVVVLEPIGDALMVHEELSGTLSHGTRDLTQTIRRCFEAQTGDMLDRDLADQVLERGTVFYGNREWDFTREVKQAKQNLAALLKSQLSELWGARKNRIRGLFWIGGGATSLEAELKGFHFNEVLQENAQWMNAIGCLTAGSAFSDEVQPEEAYNTVETSGTVQNDPPIEEEPTEENLEDASILETEHEQSTSDTPKLEGREWKDTHTPVKQTPSLRRQVGRGA